MYTDIVLTSFSGWLAEFPNSVPHDKEGLTWHRLCQSLLSVFVDRCQFATLISQEIAYHLGWPIMMLF